MKENKFKAGFKTCPNCSRDKCIVSIQIETDSETGYIYESCHECGYLKYFYDQSNEIDRPDFYKDNLEGLEAKKYLHKLKLNRDRVKNFRKKNERNRISIDYIPNDFISNLEKVCAKLGVSQAKALNTLMIDFLKNI